MSKSLIAFLLVLVLALGGVITANAVLAPTAKQVEFTEAVEAGDPAAAAGVTLRLQHNFRQSLYWNHELRPGRPSTTDFYYSLKREPAKQSDSTSLFLYLEDSLAANGAIEFGEESTIEFPSVQLPLVDVASRTKPGETHREVVNYGDYYDYYPFAAEFRVARDHSYNRFDWEEELRRQINETFRFAVLPQHQLEIEMTAARDGTITDLLVNSVFQEGERSFGIEVPCSCGNLEQLFFVLEARYSDGELFDYSGVREGYGVYRIPIETEVTRNHYISFKGPEPPRLFCPLREDESVRAMEFSGDGKTLLMAVRQGEREFLRVLDFEGNLLQEIPSVFPGGITHIVPRKNAVLLFGLDDKTDTPQRMYRALSQAPDGTLESILSGTLAPVGESEPVRISDAAFDGERLAAACEVGYGPARETVLAVYGKEGLLYQGRFTDSLNPKAAEHYQDMANTTERFSVTFE